MTEQRERAIDREPAYPPGTVFLRDTCEGCGYERQIAQGDNRCGWCLFGVATGRQKPRKRSRRKKAESSALVNLKTLREKRGLTMRDLARQAQLDVDTIGEHERGLRVEPSLATALKLARALDVPVEALVEGEFRQYIRESEAV